MTKVNQNNKAEKNNEAHIFILFFFINLISVVYSPFFPHILDAWSKRHHPNMHFMFYEDMKRVYRTLSSLFPILSVKSYKLYTLYTVWCTYAITGSARRNRESGRLPREIVQ